MITKEQFNLFLNHTFFHFFCYMIVNNSIIFKDTQLNFKEKKINNTFSVGCAKTNEMKPH